MIYIFLANGFEEVEALATVDVLRRADLNVKIVGVGSDVITGAHACRAGGRQNLLGALSA